jgi:hypothetical protein
MQGLVRDEAGKPLEGVTFRMTASRAGAAVF